MKWLKLSSLAVTLVAIALVITTVVLYRIDVRAAVESDLPALAPVHTSPPSDGAKDSPSNAIGEFQQLG